MLTTTDACDVQCNHLELELSKVQTLDLFNSVIVAAISGDEKARATKMIL